MYITKGCNSSEHGMVIISNFDLVSDYVDRHTFDLHITITFLLNCICAWHVCGMYV